VHDHEQLVRRCGLRPGDGPARRVSSAPESSWPSGTSCCSCQTSATSMTTTASPQPEKIAERAEQLAEWKPGLRKGRAGADAQLRPGPPDADRPGRRRHLGRCPAGARLTTARPPSPTIWRSITCTWGLAGGEREVPRRRGSTSPLASPSGVNDGWMAAASPRGGDAVPHPDYRIQAHVYVACPGPDEAPTTGEGPRGKFHSKSQTTLRYAVDDVRAWAAKLYGPEVGHEDVVNYHVLLESASAGDLQDAIADAIDRLDLHFEDSAGGSLNLVFSGHGSPDGDLVLADRLVSPDEVMEWCAAGRAGENEKTRHLRTVIDSCYSGLTLCRMVKHPHHWSRLVVRDGFAASLPSQEAFELRSLQHSVLTYTMVRAGNALWESAEKMTAEEFKEANASQRETTQYLTNGQQHSLDIINGHSISLRGSAAKFVEVLDTETLDELVEAVDSLPRRRRTDR
jgi:hypothetical protein